MTNLYLTEIGSVAELKNNCVVVRLHDAILSEHPLEMIESVVLIGATHITTPLLNEFLKKDIKLLFISSTGKFFGKLESASHINIERQREQFRRADDKDFCLALSKKFIISKVKNCSVILRRYNGKRISAVIEIFKKYGEKIENAKSIEQILGYEGNVSKIYFKIIGGLMPNNFKFKKRTRQPPEDKFNALISFGYTLLLYEIYTCIEIKGLHPYCSFLHQIRRGHPALASDLIEEWRATLIDSLMIDLMSNAIIRDEHFDISERGVYLTRDGVKIVIRKFEERIRIKNSYMTDGEYQMNIRDILNHQAMQLVYAIENNNPDLYKPIKIR